VVVFYIRHPGRLLDRFRRGAPFVFRFRPKYLGNFEKSTGAAPRAKSKRFALWSDLRAKGERHAVLWLLLLLGGNLLAIAAAYPRGSRRGRLLLIGILACLAMAALEFAVCALADALDDLGRHLFVFDALVDLVLIADLVWIAEIVARRFASRGAGVPVAA
jgi:hypothetical protein